MKHPLTIAWFIATGLLTIVGVGAVLATSMQTESPELAASLLPNVLIHALSMVAACLVYANLTGRLQSGALVPLGFTHLAFAVLSTLAQIGAQYSQMLTLTSGSHEMSQIAMMYSLSLGLGFIEILLFIAALIVALNARLKPADTVFQ